MTLEKHWFGQNGYRCRLEWGWRGAESAAERRDILVVVDVLSFSTAVATGVERGAVIYPCGKDEDATALARQWNAVATIHRDDVPAKGPYSLSPRTFVTASPGERILVQSPNGATCSRFGNRVPRLLVGGLVNAASVADAAARAAGETGAAITILACGERWLSAHRDGELRFALEDYLGAGAILAYLPSSLARSPEANVCEAAFTALANRLEETLRGCGSGIELIDRGYEDDVEQAARLNVYAAAPILQEGLFLSSQPLAK